VPARLMIGDGVGAERALPMNFGRQLPRTGESQRHADDRRSSSFSSEVQRPERELADASGRRAKAHLKGLVAGRLDDQKQAARTAVANTAPLRAGPEPARRRGSQGLDHQCWLPGYTPGTQAWVLWLAMPRN
jgi:hypothetical protein